MMVATPEIIIETEGKTPRKVAQALYTATKNSDLNREIANQIFSRFKKKFYDAVRYATASTGSYAKSLYPVIHNRSTTVNLKVASELYYGIHLDSGFTPHWIPIEYIEQQEENPGVPGKRVEGTRKWILSKPNPALIDLQGKSMAKTLEKDREKIINKAIEEYFVKKVKSE